MLVVLVIDVDHVTSITELMVMVPTADGVNDGVTGHGC